MKFALLTADKSHKVKFRIDCERGDCTSFMSWVSIWGGVHLSFQALREEGYDQLKEYDVVMMSGHPAHMQDIAMIGSFLRETNTVTIFYPEGSTQLYDNSIRNFQVAYYEAWNACDILSIVEEDKLRYYESFISGRTICQFIHVPTSEAMERGLFFVPRRRKEAFCVVYGDNNPNHPLIAMACARRLGLPVIAVEVDPGQLEGIRSVLPGLEIQVTTKLSHAHFLRLLGRSLVHFYPTEWIGTAREQVACAAVGTPCIGNHDSHTQRRLFPSLGFDIYDVDAMVHKAELLISDERRYDLVCRNAFEEMRFYSLESTKKRFLDAVGEAQKMKKRELVSP